MGNLIPCGSPENPCDACHLVELANNIFSFLVKTSLGLAVLCAVVAGILYLTSSGSPKLVQSAKTALKYTLIGFALTLSAWVVINVMAQTLGYKGPNTSWWDLSDFQCTWKTTTPAGIKGRTTFSSPSPDLSSFPENGFSSNAAGSDSSSSDASDAGNTSIPADAGNSTGTGTGAAGSNGSTGDQGSTTGESPGLTPDNTRRPTSIGIGDCAPAIMQTRCDAWQDPIIAEQASCICQNESGGSPDNKYPSSVDKCVDGNSYSFGINQLNLFVHCSNHKAFMAITFTGPKASSCNHDDIMGDCLGTCHHQNTSNQYCDERDCRVANQELFDDCVNSLIANNHQFGCEAYKKDGWYPWKTSARKCGLL